VRFKGFIGPSYTLKSLNVESQRCVNLYPEMNELGTGKEGEVAHLLNTPGLTNILDVGNGPIRLVYEDPLNQIFVASGNQMYKVSYSGSVWSATLLGSLSTSTGAVRAASNQLSNGDSITVFVDGTNSYAYRYIASVESYGTYASFSYSQVNGATHVEYIDGYFIFNKPDTSQFYVSEWGTFSVSPLSFASAEADPDNIVALIANHRDLWLINERTSEVFVNTGNPDFPFERVQGGFIQIGCIAAHSVAEVNGVIFWLGRDKSGHGIVYAAEGLQPQRVSTHAIETAIQGYDIDSVKNAVAYTYHAGGHSFYVLNFSDTTWVFDLTTKLWHERAYNNDGTLERHRAQNHAYISQYGFHILGDYEDNRLYQFEDDVFEDDDSPIIRIRSAPHVSSDGNRVFCKSFQLDIESGVGLTGGVQGSDPQVMLDWSDDGGHTWSNEHWVSFGKIGEYRARAKWQRLGCFRDRVFRIKISDPVKSVLIGASIDVEGGQS
jgi:hypothetical protein